MKIGNRQKPIPVSKSVEKFLQSKQNKGTGKELRLRLLWFEKFCQPLGGTDAVIQKLKIPHGQFESPSSPYEVLGDYYIYLLELNKHKKPVSLRTISFRVDAAKNLIEFATDRELSTKRLKNKINYGDFYEREPVALTRELITKLLTTSYDTRLRIFIHFLLSVGCRPIEACRLKLSNLDIASNPPKVHFPASITKIKKARTNQLTKEIAKRLSEWIEHKYRTRNKVTLLKPGKGKAKTSTEKITPVYNINDLLFAISNDVNPDSIYTELAKHFRTLLKLAGLDHKYEDGIHKITFGSCRDYVKTQIANGTNSDFSEYFIGHKGKFNYYVNDPQSAIELFKSAEPRLTFFDKDEVLEITKDTESRINVQKDEIKSLKERLTRMEQENEEERSKINPLLSLLVKESIEGKPAIPKSWINLLLSGERDWIPLPLSDSKGKDVKEFFIDKNIDSIKKNLPAEARKSQKLSNPLKSKITTIDVLKDLPEAFRLKRKG